MATDVISSLAGTLDAELEKAKENLKGVDSNLKKLFGKDVSELNTFSKFGNRRGPNSNPNYGAEESNFNESRDSNAYSRRRREDYGRHEDEPGEKRRRMDGGNRPPPVVIGPRLRPRYDQEDDYEGPQGGSGRKLQSRIVSSAREKSRDEVLAEQSKDSTSRDRNRRMFGALLGTLQRFKQEETKLKPKEEKRAQIEAKLDEAAKREREEVKKEKLQLIRERKSQLTEIKRLEIKRRRIAELEQWENKMRYLTNFIRTETKPHIFYIPKIHNPITECRLDQSKLFVTEMIANKRKLVLEDLEEFEQRSKRYWENRPEGDSINRRVEVDALDEDMEYEMKEIMKREDMNDEAEDFTVTVIESNKEAAAVQEANGNGSVEIKQEVGDDQVHERSQPMEEDDDEEEEERASNENEGSETQEETKENIIADQEDQD